MRIACALAITLASSCWADDITVPDDYATIQAAIDAASDGDTILLDRNRFIGDGNRDLDFLNKELVVRPAPGRAGVRIDTQGTNNDPHRSGFLINQTKPITFIDLVFERGYAGVVTSIVPAGEGAAFLIQDSTGVVFQNCVFRENETRREKGGAVACFNSEVTFRECHFHTNTLGSGTTGYGVDLYVGGGSVNLIDTTMELARHWSASSFDFTIHGMSAAFIGGTHTVQDCLIQNNPRTISFGGYASGAGFYIDADVTVTNTIFRNNRADFDDDVTGGTGGGAYVRGGNATFTNCLFESNEANGGYDPLEWPLLSAGAAIAVSLDGAATIVNSTFVNNSVTADDIPPLGVLFAGPDGTITIRNSIVYGNIGPALATLSNGVIDVAYSDIEGGAPGTGNIDADPLFDLAFALMPGSPAIDAADNTAVPAGVTIDLAGNPRFTDDPGTADTGVGPAPVVDMGAFEFLPQPSDCDADLTGDGTLDFFDVQEFLNRYSAGDLSVDFANDGVLDFFDVQAYLNLYAAGCP